MLQHIRIDPIGVLSLRLPGNAGLLIVEPLAESRRLWFWRNRLQGQNRLCPKRLPLLNNHHFVFLAIEHALLVECSRSHCDIAPLCQLERVLSQLEQVNLTFDLASSTFTIIAVLEVKH